MGNIILVAFFF